MSSNVLHGCAGRVPTSSLHSSITERNERERKGFCAPRKLLSIGFCAYCREQMICPLPRGIDVMKRLASRSTWWHIVPHKSYTRSTPQTGEASHGPYWP